MKKKTIWLVVGCLFTTALLVTSCNQAVTKEEAAPSEEAANNITATITFIVPKELPPATVGIPYSYSFATATNPAGGNPPYTFVLGSGVGFPPFGLILDLNGLLSGTPTAAGTRTFEVCVNDLGGNQACQMTSLTVEAAPAVWTGTFEIIGAEDQNSIGVNYVQEYHASGEFSFRILSDDTIEGSGTAQGEYTSFQSSGGNILEGEASFTTDFSVRGYYYQGVESTIQFRDLSPSEFTITTTTYWKDGETTSYTLSVPVFYGFTYMAIGIEIVDGATDEDTEGWGGMGEIRRIISLSRQD